MRCCPGREWQSRSDSEGPSPLRGGLSHGSFTLASPCSSPVQRGRGTAEGGGGGGRMRRFVGPPPPPASLVPLPRCAGEDHGEPGGRSYAIALPLRGGAGGGGGEERSVLTAPPPPSILADAQRRGGGKLTAGACGSDLPRMRESRELRLRSCGRHENGGSRLRGNDPVRELTMRPRDRRTTTAGSVWAVAGPEARPWASRRGAWPAPWAWRL